MTDRHERFVRPRTPPLILPLCAALLGALGASCSGGGVQTKPRPREELLNPETCKECHAQHYEDWSGSMHAYAAEDPVFLAMNQRGQEETNGALGDFCVNCHAPMAVIEGATTDGLNLDEVADELKGVTCYFCHSADGIEQQHNNGIVLAAGNKGDVTMRGPFDDPAPGAAHESAYSPLLDSTTAESGDMCGVCHDIVLPSPPAPSAAELERTHKEWQETLFGPTVKPETLVTCATCHMYPSPGPVAEAENLEVPSRTVHGHDFPGVDVALTSFPEMERQRENVQQFLNTSLRVDVCVEQLPSGSTFRVALDNIGPGHGFPSGATQDRRVWIEVRAFEGDTVCYENGVVADGQSVAEAAAADPDIWQLRDFTKDENGEEAHMFWEVAEIERGTIPGPITNIASEEGYLVTHVKRDFPSSGTAPDCFADRVTVRVRVRPIGLDVIDDLVASGHDPGVRDAMPTFDLLPNAGIASIPSLRDITFEWSDATKNDPRFDQFPDPSGGHRFECIGMRRPGR